MNHFFAVKDNQEIVEWREVRDKYGLTVVGYGPIKTIFSGKGIKAIASAPGNLDDRDPKSSPFGLVALFDDGTVMGWGITATGQLTREADTPSVVLTKLPGAIGIAMNAFHTVILTAQGVPQFFGGCDLYGRDGTNSGHLWSHGRLNGVNGVVNDVSGMALAQEPNFGGAGGWGNDTGSGADIFINRDGIVWLAHAPLPAGASGFECGQQNPTIDYIHAQKLPAGNAAAVQVATAGGLFFMLDANHGFWATQGNYGKTEFHFISINLRNL
jgi:hypothetical protein